jgi:hypothetical protein
VEEGSPTWIYCPGLTDTRLLTNSDVQLILMSCILQRVIIISVDVDATNQMRHIAAYLLVIMISLLASLMCSCMISSSRARLYCIFMIPYALDRTKLHSFLIITACHTNEVPEAPILFKLSRVVRKGFYERLLSSDGYYRCFDATNQMRHIAAYLLIIMISLLASLCMFKFTRKTTVFL